MYLSVQLRGFAKGYYASLYSIARYCDGLLFFSVFECSLLQRVIKHLSDQLSIIVKSYYASECSTASYCVGSLCLLLSNALSCESLLCFSLSF